MVKLGNVNKLALITGDVQLLTLPKEVPVENKRNMLIEYWVQQGFIKLQGNYYVIEYTLDKDGMRINGQKL